MHQHRWLCAALVLGTSGTAKGFRVWACTHHGAALNRSPMVDFVRWPRFARFAQLPVSEAVSMTPIEQGTRASAVADAPMQGPLVFRTLTRADVEVRYSRSGGAGGQNVNKVETKAEARLDLGAAAWVPAAVRSAIRSSEAGRVSKADVLVVTSSVHRTQAANTKDALAKLQGILDAAAAFVAPPNPPSKEKVARTAKRKKAADNTRLEGKKKNAQKKAGRRRLSNTASY